MKRSGLNGPKSHLVCVWHVHCTDEVKLGNDHFFSFLKLASSYEFHFRKLGVKRGEREKKKERMRWKGIEDDEAVERHKVIRP